MNARKILIANIFLCIIGIMSCTGQKQSNTKKADTIALAPCPVFVSDSAMQYVKDQCSFGPRLPESEASAQCGDYIMEKFEQFGTQVSEQFAEVTVYDGSKVSARNIIASINPENPDRILFCAHWDSRPWADNDPNPDNHMKPVMGANDGASGVAVMLEMARVLQQSPVKLGIDFVCFDVEDMGTPEWAENEFDSGRETWCLGSKAWAEAARNNQYSARYGILMDMVGGRGCTFSKELISQEYAGPIVEMVWKLAGQMGYRHYFPLKDGGYLMDDHVNVNLIAGIPCLDIVPHFTEGPSNFGPTWHTVEDTPDNIDPNVLNAVGQTLVQLIYNEDAQ